MLLAGASCLACPLCDDPWSNADASPCPWLLVMVLRSGEERAAALVLAARAAVDRDGLDFSTSFTTRPTRRAGPCTTLHGARRQPTPCPNAQWISLSSFPCCGQERIHARVVEQTGIPCGADQQGNHEGYSTRVSGMHPRSRSWLSVCRRSKRKSWRWSRSSHRSAYWSVSTSRSSMLWCLRSTKES